MKPALSLRAIIPEDYPHSAGNDNNRVVAHDASKAILFGIAGIHFLFCGKPDIS